MIWEKKKKKNSPRLALGPQDFIPANEHLDLRRVLSCITISFSAVPV